jgi:hypothetical protein
VNPSLRAPLALAAVALAVLGAARLFPPPTAVGEARYTDLVALDDAGRVLRTDGSTSQVTALSLFDASGGELLFARVRGRWRCVSYFLAPADGERIAALVNAIASAEPMVATPERDASEFVDAFELDAGAARRVVLRGPKALDPNANGDVLVDVWLGHGGAVRRAEAGVPRDELLRLATPFDAWFAAPVTLDPNELPPLVLPRVVPPDWPGFAEGLARVFVDRADGSGFEVERVPDDTLPPGISAWNLRESPDDAWIAAHPLLATGFTLFLARAAPLRAVDPRDVPALVSERPDVTITLVSSANTVLELRVGPEQIDGRRLVINTDTQTAFELAPRPAELLTPPTDWLITPGASIPWDPYLR